MAAANAQAPALPIKIYPTSDEVENILAVYQQALQAGAQVVVGPLTKNGVSALAASSMVNVPTLALNIPETEIATPKKLYLFGLAVEPEARQVARLAFAEGAKSALTVSARTPLAKRMQQAFADEWQMLGGTLGAQLTFSSAGNLEALHESVLKHPADVIFLAANVREARLVRPYLDAAIPTYATSQTYSDKAGAQKNIDLDGISFVDMPWLLQPDHPAVMVYPHPETSMNVDLERLYALGIDALRLTRLLLNGPPAPGSAILDGVTGKISLGADRQFTRELTPAQFKQDVVVVLDSPTP